MQRSKRSTVSAASRPGRAYCRRRCVVLFICLRELIRKSRLTKANERRLGNGNWNDLFHPLFHLDSCSWNQDATQRLELERAPTVNPSVQYAIGVAKIGLMENFLESVFVSDLESANLNLLGMYQAGQNFTIWSIVEIDALRRLERSSNASRS